MIFPADRGQLEGLSVTTDEFTIRTARPTDYEAICALLDQLDEMHRAHVPWLFRRPELPARTPEEFRALIKGEDSTVLVAEAAAVIGTALVLMRAAPDVPVFIPQRWAVIDNIVVAPEWRRRGVGLALSRAAEEWARGKGASGIELNVYEFNADAGAFYRTAGYAPLLTKLRKPL